MMANTEPTPNAPAAPELITRAEAARHCRVCLSSFDRYVRPNLTETWVGGRVVFRRVELEAWLAAPATRRVSAAARMVAEKTARERAVATTSELANEIADRIRARRAKGKP